MNGWQEPKNRIRTYIVPDNTLMEGFIDYVPEEYRDIIDVSGESKTNLGIFKSKQEYRSSSLVGLCRLKTISGTTIRDQNGNELVLNVIPRFPVKILEMLNYISTDDEFDRYLAPQVNRMKDTEKIVLEGERNELFHFYKEKPLKVESGPDANHNILSITLYLHMLKALCQKPLFSHMVQQELNCTGMVKGKIVVEKNISYNTLHGRDDRVYCRYLSRTTDIPENRLLKLAMEKCKKYIYRYFEGSTHALQSYVELLSFCNSTLKHVNESLYNPSDATSFKFTGVYAYYKPVVDLAQLIVNDISINTDGHSTTFSYTLPYAVSMDRLFEVCVRTHLKSNGICSYRHPEKGKVYLEKYDAKREVLLKSANKDCSTYISGPVKPDLILKQEGTHKTAIIDVKYKDPQSRWYRDLTNSECSETVAVQ